MTDTAAAYGMAGWPFWSVICALFVIVLGRSHLFYWLGRGLLTGTGRLVDRVLGPVDGPGTPAPARPAAASAAEGPATGPARLTALRAWTLRLMGTPTARRALAMLHRWGPLAVTVAYVTVGIQTAVFVAAGLTRMPYLRFVLASLPGAVAWAFIWGTVGLGAVWAAVRLAAASPWALVGAVLLLAALLVTRVLHRRARPRPADAPTPGTPVEHPHHAG